MPPAPPPSLCPAPGPTRPRAPSSPRWKWGKRPRHDGRKAMTHHDVPAFHVGSESFAEGQTVPPAQRSGRMRAGGQDESPQLSWSGAPAETRGYAVTMFDPDAPAAAASGTGRCWTSPPMSRPCPPEREPKAASFFRPVPAAEERRRIPRLPRRCAASRPRPAPLRRHGPCPGRGAPGAGRAHVPGKPRVETRTPHRPGPRHAHGADPDRRTPTDPAGAPGAAAPPLPAGAGPRRLAVCVWLQAILTERSSAMRARSVTGPSVLSTPAVTPGWKSSSSRAGRRAGSTLCRTARAHRHRHLLQRRRGLGP